jgi:hypothetical protein
MLLQQGTGAVCAINLLVAYAYEQGMLDLQHLAAGLLFITPSALSAHDSGQNLSRA